MSNLLFRDSPCRSWRAKDSLRGRGQPAYRVHLARPCLPRNPSVDFLTDGFRDEDYESAEEAVGFARRSFHLVGLKFSI